jgi:preprotein translocase subunit SecB
MTSPSSSAPPAAAASDANQDRPVFGLQRVYLKDCSLEAPHVPEIFLDSKEPRLEFQLDTFDRELGGAMVEVGIRCTVTCRLGDRVAFLVEASEAGIFEISGVNDEQRVLLKGISCPSIVYPYLRANLADIVQRASFPQFHLSEINWEAFFQQKQAHLAQENAAAAPAGDGQRSSPSDSGLILPS